MSTILEAPSTQEAIAARPLQQSGGLLERSAALAVVTSADGRIVLANRAWTDLLGYASDTVLGRLLTHFVHPDHAAPFAAMLRESAESGAAQCRRSRALPRRNTQVVVLASPPRCRPEPVCHRL